jgi:hypothetical protein
VADVDRGHAEGVVQPAEFQADLLAGGFVQGADRLVKQQDLRLEHDRPAERDPLPFAAGQSAAGSAQQVLDLQSAGHPANAILNLGPRAVADRQPEGDVRPDGQGGEQGVVLRHIADVPVGWVDPLCRFAVQGNGPADDRPKATDHLDQAGLARPRRPEQHAVSAVLHAQGNVPQRERAEVSGDVIEDDHGLARQQVWEKA